MRCREEMRMRKSTKTEGIPRIFLYVLFTHSSYSILSTTMFHFLISYNILDNNNIKLSFWVMEISRYIVSHQHSTIFFQKNTRNCETKERSEIFIFIICLEAINKHDNNADDDKDSPLLFIPLHFIVFLIVCFCLVMQNMKNKRKIKNLLMNFFFFAFCNFSWQQRRTLLMMTKKNAR